MHAGAACVVGVLAVYLCGCGGGRVCLRGACAYVCVCEAARECGGGATCHHQGPDALHPPLHGGLHESREAVTVPPLHVQPRVVVQQVVTDHDVSWTGREGGMEEGERGRGGEEEGRLRANGARVGETESVVKLGTENRSACLCRCACLCACVRVTPTCLCGSDEGGVSLVVLPVHIQVRTLRQSDDHVHVALVTRHHQPCLGDAERQTTSDEPSAF